MGSLTFVCFDERLSVRAEPDSETWAALDEDLQRGLKLLVDRMDQD